MKDRKTLSLVVRKTGYRYTKKFWIRTSFLGSFTCLKHQVRLLIQVLFFQKCSCDNVYSFSSLAVLCWISEVHNRMHSRTEKKKLTRLAFVVEHLIKKRRVIIKQFLLMFHFFNSIVIVISAF